MLTHYKAGIPLKVEEGEKVIVSAELNEVQKIIGPAELPNSLGEFEDNKG